MTTLATLLSGMEAVFQGDAQTVVSGIAYDSRRVRAGDVFVAIPGYVHDGARFAGAAVAAGAVAVVAEVKPDDVDLPLEPAVWASVDDARVALAQIAAKVYEHPSRSLEVVGVTGTNGKTTVTALLESILGQRGDVGRWSTTTVRVAGERRPAHRTTPEAPDLQRALREMVDVGCWAAVIEVSSHALVLHRTDGTEFAAAVFTNLSSDHLDFHETLDDYRDAKALLFERLSKDALAVLNLDDPTAPELARRTRARLAGFGWTDQARPTPPVYESAPRGPDPAPSFATPLRAYRIVEWRPLDTGSLLRLEGPTGQHEFASPLFGPPNAENLAAAIATALETGCTPDQVRKGVAAFSGARGRLELVDQGQPFAVLIDYAHTPAALEAAIASARSLAAGHRVIVTFGCGGDRDTGKRPLMGRIAADAADLAVITSDNPRSEDPEAILDAIEAGVPEATANRVEREVDRRLAVERALSAAGPGDCVLIAGKGHETEQIFADRVVDFDDAEVAAGWLEPRYGARPTGTRGARPAEESTR